MCIRDSINTLYRIFGSKDNILTACVNYGFSQLENTFFDALKEFDKSSFDIFPELVKIGMDFAPKMRFLHQAISSPLYESRRQVQFKKLNAFYDRFGKELAMRFDCPYELIRDYIYEIMTLISYFSPVSYTHLPHTICSFLHVNFTPEIRLGRGAPVSPLRLLLGDSKHLFCNLRGQRRLFRFKHRSVGVGNRRITRADNALSRKRRLIRVIRPLIRVGGHPVLIYHSPRHVFIWQL